MVLSPCPPADLPWAGAVRCSRRVCAWRTGCNVLISLPVVYQWFSISPDSHLMIPTELTLRL